MDPNYKNKTILNKNTCREFLAMTWPQNGGIIRIFLMITGVGSFLYGLMQLLLFGLDAWLYALGLILMACVALFIAGWRYLLRLGGTRSSKLAAGVVIRW